MKKSKAYIGFILPGFLLYTIFMIVPIVFSMYYSFFDWNGIGAMKFVGLNNYQTLLFTPRMSKIFFNALFNNLKYLLSVWFIITPVQIFFAYMLHIKIPAHKWIRLMLFLPYVISTAIVAFFSIIVFDPNIGLLNSMASFFGITGKAWLGDPNMAFKLFVGVVIWQSIGSGMMIFYANMQEVPKDTIEASIIDGVGEWRKFWNVILPQCTSSLTTNIVLGTIFGLTIFDIPFLLGGPQGGTNNTLDFVNMVFYRYAFGGSYFGETSLGFGSSISVTMFLMILVATLVQLKVLKSFEYDI